MRVIQRLFFALLVVFSGAALAHAFQVKVGAVATLFPSQGGVKVFDFIPGGLAEACLQNDDVIIAVNEIPINSATDVVKVNAYQYSPGEKVRVIYQRGSKYEIAARKVSTNADNVVVIESTPATYSFGTDFEVEIGLVLSFNDNQPGGKITNILDTGWAITCVQVGDRIVAVNGNPVNKAADFPTVNKAKCSSGDIFRIIYERGGYYYFTLVKIGGPSNVVVINVYGGPPE